MSHLSQKNSHGTYGLVAHFWEPSGGKGAHNRRFGSTYGTVFCYLWGSGDLVKIALSRERELDPEGWRGSDIR